MKKFSLMTLYSLVDGRLSYSGMDGVYDSLGFICQFDGIMTHHLPTALKYIKENKPEWFIKVEKELADIAAKVGDDFETQMTYIKAHNTEYDIPQIPDNKVQEFQEYMVENSLLKTIGSNRR